jgi:hypothetical protein
MTEIRIPYVEPISPISNWLFDQGLEFKQDWFWHIDPGTDELVVRVNDEKMAVLFSLKWGGQ